MKITIRNHRIVAAVVDDPQDAEFADSLSWFHVLFFIPDGEHEMEASRLRQLAAEKTRSEYLDSERRECARSGLESMGYTFS